MKKTLTVNLGNRIYNIDDDAYIALKEYLDRIESHFSDQSERADILNDIELRLSELLSERLRPDKQVIILRDIEAVTAIMGDPRIIAGEKEQDEKEASYSGGERSTGPRRFYRDPDNRIIGGVCGGLGAYLDIDPVIVRVILVVLFLAFGIGLLIYIIMWILVPEARTTAQKLEMRGDSVNLSNIGKFARDEFENVKKNFRRNKKHKI